MAGNELQEANQGLGWEKARQVVEGAKGEGKLPEGK